MTFEIQDRLRGALLGLALSDAMCTEKSSYLVEPVQQSSSLKLAETLAKNMYENEAYDRLSILEGYRRVYLESNGPPGLDTLEKDFEKSFEEKFKLKFDEVFEDHPAKSRHERTGIFHRVTMLLGSKNLDDLIQETWMFDPYVETFEDIYLYFTVLRILVKYGKESLMSVLSIDESSKIRKIINETLHLDIDLRYIDHLDREEFCIFGTVYGAMKGYSALMQDRVTLFNSRFLETRVLNEEFISFVSSRI